MGSSCFVHMIEDDVAMISGRKQIKGVSWIFLVSDLQVIDALSEILRVYDSG